MTIQEKRQFKSGVCSGQSPSAGRELDVHFVHVTLRSTIVGKEPIAPAPSMIAAFNPTARKDESRSEPGGALCSATRSAHARTLDPIQAQQGSRPAWQSLDCSGIPVSSRR